VYIDWFIKVGHICDPILENRRCTHNRNFVINRTIKTMGKIQKSNNKIMQDCLDSQWINALINKSWVSLCSPAHWVFKKLCFVLFLEFVLELWLFVHVGVMKEFIDDLFSVSTPSLSGTEIYIGGEGGWTVNYILVGRNSWQIKWAKFQLCTPLH